MRVDHVEILIYDYCRTLEIDFFTFSIMRYKQEMRSTRYR